jgi:hypothetical protein
MGNMEFETREIFKALWRKEFKRVITRKIFFQLIQGKVSYFGDQSLVAWYEQNIQAGKNAWEVCEGYLMRMLK